MKDLLDQFEERKKVLNWWNQGGILVDYLLLLEKVGNSSIYRKRNSFIDKIFLQFENLKNAASNEEIEIKWEILKPILTELCSRINLFPCPTAKHRLCQSEISQKLVCIVGGIIQANSDEINPCQLVRMSLEKLPLPLEYAQNELRMVIDSFAVDNIQ